MFVSWKKKKKKNGGGKIWKWNNNHHKYTERKLHMFSTLYKYSMHCLLPGNVYHLIKTIYPYKKQYLFKLIKTIIE